MHLARRASDLARERAQRDLKRLLPALASRFRLHRALAFGSFARGDMHELSDLDLVLVGDFQCPQRERQRSLRDLVWELDLETPVEVLALTPEELERARQRRFFAHILADAVELSLDGGNTAG